jgi:hypothetical protein
MIWFKFNDIRVQVIESEIIVQKIQLNINEAEKILNKKHCHHLNMLSHYPPTFHRVDAGCVYISYVHDAGIAVVYQHTGCPL